MPQESDRLTRSVGEIEALLAKAEANYVNRQGDWREEWSRGYRDGVTVALAIIREAREGAEEEG